MLPGLFGRHRKIGRRRRDGLRQVTEVAKNDGGGVGAVIVRGRGRRGVPGRMGGQGIGAVEKQGGEGQLAQVSHGKEVVFDMDGKSAYFLGNNRKKHKR